MVDFVVTESVKGHFVTDDQGVILVVFLHFLGDFLDGVQNGGMMLVAKGLADFGERHTRELSGEVHGDLPRLGNAFGIIASTEVFGLNLVTVGNEPFDLIAGNLCIFLFDNVFQTLLSELKVDGVFG
jgi:hypothetical protein